jgi:hypothetical protein
MAPVHLAAHHHSLPRILYKTYQDPKSGCSKAPRGLSVLLRVLRIFTKCAISPSSLLRQRPNRYAIRAGRNLPDKEFRYLRTVIVTAAVYRGFNSDLRNKLLSPPLNLPAPGRRQPLYFAFWAWQRPVFLLNSRLGHFTAASVSIALIKNNTNKGTPSPEVTELFCRVP